MIDVHPPRHVFGVRDFFIHLLTITAGLLIAIGLEQSVEKLHHRHQRQEAETKIRDELRSNQEMLLGSVAGLQDERKVMISYIGFLRDTEKGNDPGGQQRVQLQFHEGEIPDAAWRTASSTGVMEYLPYDEIETFADAYREQALLQTIAQKALEDYLELIPMQQSDAKTRLTPEDARLQMPIALQALGHLNGMMAVGAGTLDSYKRALQ